MAPLTKSYSLPFLPGCVPHDLHKPKQFRPQTLAYRLDCSVDNKQKLPATSDEMQEIMKTISDPTWRFKHTGQKVLNGADRRAIVEANRNTYRPREQPAWLKHNRQVLRFEAFFQEKVEESALENFRYRHCVIMYYLEDGTLQISEPRIENSGVPQGAFIKRHVVPLPDGRPIQPMDFGLGKEIEIYGKVFKICKCDKFTKWFFEESGLELGEEYEPPADMNEKLEDHKEMVRTKAFGLPRGVVEGKEYNELKLGGSRSNSGLEQFLKNDRKVLRFYSYWDDHTRYGARQYQVVHFFLSDNTVEMLEQYPRNSGRDAFPVLFKRRPLLKNFCSRAVPGMLQPDPIIVLPADLICGQTFYALGRTFVLYDCDDFTRHFYKESMGIDQESFPSQVADDPIYHQQLTFPPHIGPGTEEDSAQNCLMLMPKAAKRDLVKLTTLDGKILRFEARCANFQVEDEQRRFIIAIYAADDTVACYEIKQRNSGVWEGKFAERGRKRNPSTGEWFKPLDFYVGTTVVISAMPMYIIRADEYTLKYMESNPMQFPASDIVQILEKLAPLRDDAEFASATHFAPDDLREFVEMKLGLYLVDHELITLLRSFGAPSEEPYVDVAKMLERM